MSKEETEKKKISEQADVQDAQSEVLVSEEKKDEKAEAPKKKKKKIRNQIHKGQAHIQCTYNNTMISITDISGGSLGWSSSGLLGFKGAKKATSYAATQVVSDIAEKVKKYGIAELEVFVKGVGSGREAAIRALANKGFDLVLIKDITPIPHNGCRPRKPRRV
jgi:small subunit ribosomal protein S11